MSRDDPSTNTKKLVISCVWAIVHCLQSPSNFLTFMMDGHIVRPSNTTAGWISVHL
jgi:DTW domain-containing protein YfiP